MTNEPGDIIYSLNHLTRLLVENPYREWRNYGNVVVSHQDDLTQFHYSRKMIIAKTWNKFETISRGLIINNQSGEIVARPFDKFFNWGQRLPDVNAKFLCRTRKLDGALGIQYFHKGEWWIATKGGFSDHRHAQWATRWLRENVNTDYTPENHTLMYEILYKDSLVVVPDNRERLVLIGCRHFDGAYHAPYSFNFGVHAGLLGVEAVERDLQPIDNDAISAEIDHEGYVSWWKHNGNYSMYKHKTKWYRVLHKMVDNEPSPVQLARTEQRTRRYTEIVGSLREALETLAIYTELNLEDRGVRKEMAIRIYSDYPKYLAGMLTAIVFNDVSPEQAAIKYLDNHKRLKEI